MLIIAWEKTQSQDFVVRVEYKYLDEESYFTRKIAKSIIISMINDN